MGGKEEIQREEAEGRVAGRKSEASSLRSVAAVRVAGAALYCLCCLLASLGRKKKERKKKLCASLQNKALVKNSVCSRDSVLT